MSSRELIWINSWLNKYLGDLNRFISWLRCLTRELIQNQLTTQADPRYWFRSSHDLSAFLGNWLRINSQLKQIPRYWINSTHDSSKKIIDSESTHDSTLSHTHVCSRPIHRFLIWRNWANNAHLWTFVSCWGTRQLKQLQCFKQHTKMLPWARRGFMNGVRALEVVKCHLKPTLDRGVSRPREPTKTSQNLRTRNGRPLSNNCRTPLSVWCLVRLLPTHFKGKIANETSRGKMCAPTAHVPTEDQKQSWMNACQELKDRLQVDLDFF